MSPTHGDPCPTCGRPRQLSPGRDLVRDAVGSMWLRDGRGHSQREIAAEVDRSQSTVQCHLEALSILGDVERTGHTGYVPPARVRAALLESQRRSA